MHIENNNFDYFIDNSDLHSMGVCSEEMSVRISKTNISVQESASVKDISDRNMTKFGDIQHFNLKPYYSTAIRHLKQLTVFTIR